MKRDELKSELYGVLTKHMHITHDGSDDHINDCLSEILLRLQLNSAPPYVAKQTLSEEDLKRLAEEMNSQPQMWLPYNPPNPSPKWISGPPTTTGWHWLKHCLPDFVLVKNIKSVDAEFIRSANYEVIPASRILAHCPIQEPEE